MGAQQIVRARLRGFDPQTWLADVEPVAGPAALLSDVPVLGAVRAEELVAGREVALLLWPELGGVVLGPWEPPQGGRLLWKAGSMSPANDLTLSTAGQDLVRCETDKCPAGLLLVAATVVWQCTAWTAAANVNAGLVVDGTQLHWSYATATAVWGTAPITVLGAINLAAGDHVWRVTASKASAANTIVASALSRLLWAYYR